MTHALLHSPLLAAVLVAAFLVGAIPFGWLIGKLRGVDLRKIGSGNIGATNAGRALGRGYGVLVLILDALKGAAGVLLARALVDEVGLASLPVLACIAAVLGHSFTPFLAFRGGKGVATAAGGFLGLHWMATLGALLVWALTLLLGRRVALASLAAAWSLPGLVLLLGGAPRGALLAVSLAMAVLITLRHRSNIARMLRGEEPRIEHLLRRRSPLGRES